jgi:hypothetical protein
VSLAIPLPPRLLPMLELFAPVAPPPQSSSSSSSRVSIIIIIIIITIIIITATYHRHTIRLIQAGKHQRTWHGPMRPLPALFAPAHLTWKYSGVVLPGREERRRERRESGEEGEEVGKEGVKEE